MLQGTAEQLIPEQSHRPRHAKPDQLAILPVGDAAGRSYEDLYVEHAPVARAVALSMVPRDVADDIVAEAFTRVLGAIRAGGGPGVAFRAYLLTAVRNTANDWLRASRRTTAVGDVEHDLDDRVPEENLGLARLSRGPEAEAEARVEAQLVAKAFAKLPERWQAVLWQLEVETKAPAAVAPAFGLSANGVSALAVRAREGLRQAYLAEHVGANIPEACRAYAEALSADTRGRLSRRRQAAVHDHLDQCASCHSLAGELTELNGRLGAILAPAALAAALAGRGHDLLHFSTGHAIKAGAAKAWGAAKAGAGHAAAAKAGAGAKAATGAKTGLGAKAGMSAKAVLSSQWKLHPLTATAAATAGLAAAGGMVFAVGVSPMSPFHTQQVTERPAAASSDVIAPALGGLGKHAAAAGQAAGTGSAAASSAPGSAAPSSNAASGVGAGSQGSGSDYVPRHAADGNTGSADRGATPDPVGSLIGGVGSTVQGVTSGLGSTVQGVTTGVGSTVQGVTTGVGSVVQGVAGGAGATVTGLGQTVNGVTQGLGSTVNQTTTGLGNAISGVTQALSGGNATVTALGNTASSLVQGVGGVVDGATGPVGSTVGGATAGVGNVTANAGAAVSGVTSGAGAAVNGVTSGVGSTVSGVTSGLGSGVSGLLGGGKS